MTNKMYREQQFYPHKHETLSVCLLWAAECNLTMSFHGLNELRDLK